MPGEALRIGPFEGGMNTASDPTAVADSELVDCVNLELDLDGSLVCRPPIQDFTDFSATTTERLVMLGVAVFSGTNYIIASNANGVFRFNGGVWSTITATFQARCMVQYSGKVWLPAIPGSANPGGNWDPVGGFTAVAAIPKGEACKIFKERLFVAPGISATANESRLSFSDPGNFASWPGANFIDIRPGDGQQLIDLAIYKSNLLLFKNDSCDVLAYDTTPSDAVRENISVTVGATTRRCVIEFEDSVFVYHEGDVFEIVNYNFNQINTKVPFTFDNSAPSTRAEEVFMCLFGQRLLIRYYNRIYVYGLRTRTWSRWESTSSDLHNFGPLVSLPSNVVAAVNDEYYAGSSILSNEKVYRIKDGFDATTNELANAASFTISCRAKTKNFDLAASQLYKRLYWWGADVLTGNNVLGIATPITIGASVLWGDLFNNSKEAPDLGTWASPLTGSVAVNSTVTGLGAGGRVFVKFLKALRFRQINFEVDLTSNGTTVDGPARLFTLIIVASTRQTVVKSVN